MFLSDQQKANKAQSIDLKLLDVAANAIKEWDTVVSIRDEYMAKSLQGSEGSGCSLLTNAQQKFTVGSKVQPSLLFGRPLRPVSAFFQFKEDNYKQVLKDNPTLDMNEISKIIAGRWANADQKTRDYYEAKRQEAKEQYEQWMKLYDEASENYEATREKSSPTTEIPFLSYLESRR